MKTFLLIAFIIFFATLNPIAAHCAETAKSRFSDNRFSINFRNTPITEALRLIAAKGHLQLKTSGALEGQVNFAIRNSTLEDALNQISEDLELVYQINGKDLVVSRKQSALAKNASQARSPAAAGQSGSAPDGRQDNVPAVHVSGGNQGMIFRSIPILYANLHEILIHIQKTLQPGESAVADDSNNALVVFSGPETVAQIQSFIKLFDTRPTQILIEAQIVETTKNFARSLGVSWGETTIPHANGSTVTITNPGPSGNVSLRGLLGSIDGHLLEANLTAAESRGDAKIVSRPKVFTLNNHKAIIHSGLTYNIKTLSGVASSSAGPSANAGQLTGGITAITSGLELEVTPGVVGDGLIRLAIKVKNSEPDLGSSVDGIPGLNDNSAETSILVKGGQTATMAGLLKNTASKNTSGVPWISHIPVIGWLFSANANSDVTSELMIFLTPNIVDVTGDQPKVSAPTKSEHAPASVSETK